MMLTHTHTHYLSLGGDLDAKRYASLGNIAHEALKEFCTEVEGGAFPSKDYSPYRIGPAQREILTKRLRARGLAEVADKLESFSIE
mmetsp:Transcript_3216/g.11200  ORF Transcript_3216/g.11200 Transcript_3216/m.11200 type:complete len:86 (+) Transcript_3216:881-1138(+)